MLLDQYSMANKEYFQNKKYSLKEGQSHSVYVLLIISVISFSFLFLSAFHSRHIISQIEEKEIKIMKLKKSYQSLMLENEKLGILISEITQDNDSNRVLIQLTGNLKFKKQAEVIEKQYQEELKKSQKKDYFTFFMIIALIITALSRLLYIEFGKKEPLPVFF